MYIYAEIPIIFTDCVAMAHTEKEMNAIIYE